MLSSHMLSSRVKICSFKKARWKHGSHGEPLNQLVNHDIGIDYSWSKELFKWPASDSSG